MTTDKEKVLWDYYDDCPLDPNYISLSQKGHIKRMREKAMKLIHPSIVETNAGYYDCLQDKTFPYEWENTIKVISNARWRNDNNCSKGMDKANRAVPTESIRFSGTRIA